jgi:DNA-binding MarR family transcriptional regulator
MGQPKQSSDRPALARALAAAEVFQQRLMTLHATEFTTLDITMAQAKLLYVVANAGELSMSDIALRLGVTISTSSGGVERLVELGLLARSDDPSNRRQVRVSVTPTGARTLEQVRELSGRPFHKLLELLSDEDLDVVERATRIMADAITVTVSSTPGGTPHSPESPLSSQSESRKA